VSPLWRNRLHLGLSPGGVSCLRLARGWRPRAVAHGDVACAPAATGEAPWQPALTTLSSVLQDNAGAEAVVVLSNHFVRYALVPFHERLVRPADDLALARHQFLEAYGPLAANWSVRMSDTGRDRGPRLACAIDGGLLEALRKLCREQRIALISVQPYLMAAFNQWQAQFDSTGSFALLEAGRLCLLRFRDAQWQSVTSRRIGADWLSDFATLRGRERMLSGVDAAEPGSTYVCAPDQPAPTAEQQRQHPDLVWLPAAAETPPASTPSGYALALSGG